MIVAGFGMRADVTEASLQDALDQTGYAPDVIATVADKAEFIALQAFARAQKLPFKRYRKIALIRYKHKRNHRHRCIIAARAVWPRPRL